MSKILVTGGAGFIGSHMCERLLSKGYEVVCIDNLYTGSLQNIAHLQENPLFTFIQQDIIEPIDLECDKIINLACPASPPHYQKDAIQTWRTSVLGINNLLELAKKNNASILQASTSEVYGDPDEHPQKESYWGNVNPIGIRSCYDEGKRAAEALIMDFHRQHNVDTKIVRIFNTYGPHMDIHDGRVVSNFIIQALKNENITIYGDGKQTRSFQYVSDLIDGLVLFLETPNLHEPINMGNPYHELNMLELAQLIIKKTGSKSKLVHSELPKDDPLQRKPDISRAQNLLGWRPKVSFEEGLDSTIAYFKKMI